MLATIALSLLTACGPSGHHECRGGHYVSKPYTYLMPIMIGKGVIMIPETSYRDVCEGGTEVFVTDPPPTPSPTRSPLS